MSLSHSPISPLKFPFPRTPIDQINPITLSFHCDKHTKNKTPKQPPLLSNGTTESTPLPSSFVDYHHQKTHHHHELVTIPFSFN
jgi:hypothetical protein